MAVTVEIPFKAALKSPKPADDVLAYLADWQESIGRQFPGLKVFRQATPGIYQWEFQEVGYKNFRLAIIFSTRMEITPPRSASVQPHSGAHKLKMLWTVAADTAGSRADLDLNFVVELPVPGLLKGLAAGFARTELTKLLERYAANVEKALSA